MSISIDALRSYVEKIAKKVLNDESSKPVISGTIKSSLPGIYEVQLVNGNETSLVRAESLYADKTFAVDDYVYLVRAENNRGDEYETKYFIVGLVTTVEQNFANLTEWERFLGDGQKIISQFNNEVIIVSQTTNTEDDPSTTENEANNFTNFINAVRTNGVFLFSTKVTTNITEQTDFGFKFTFTFDDDNTKEELFPGTTFVGQPWSLSEVTQKKIFNLGTQNTLKSITITKVNPTNVDFNAIDVSLESGTFLDLAQDFKVTLENVKGKNYFNKSADNGVVQIKANVNYGNQKLDTKALKYYWFVKKDNAININSLGGNDWECLNNFSHAKIIDETGVKVKEDVLIYKTDDNILEITYDDANNVPEQIPDGKSAEDFKNWLPHYENEIKCVVGYQLVNATSEPIKIYNFKHESYEVTIKFSDNTELPLLYLEETARINATLNQKLVGLTANDIYYRWYLNDETEPLSYIEKEETIYYSGSSLVIGYPEKSSKEVYRLSGEYGNFTCKVFKNDGSNEVIADAPPALRVWSAIAADKQLKEEKHYVYWLDVANNLRFSSFEENAKIQNEIDTKYIIYKANGETPGTVVPGIDENAFDWLNGSAPFTEDGVYYLYYSEQVQVKSALESNPNVVYRYNDFSEPQILRHVERKTEKDGKIEVIDLLNDGKIEQLNTFNRLSNNGLSNGIYYNDVKSKYEKTRDTAPISNKLTTGKGYYKKVETYEYQKVDINKFEENKDYYIKKANGEYEKYAGDFDKKKEYYIRQLIETEYILREKNSENYEMSGKEPQNFKSGEEYYEQIEGGDLYINASFIRTGHLEVSDGTSDGTVFSADIDNKTVKIGGFHVTKDHLSSGETTGDHKVLMSPGYKPDGSNTSYAFWAGNRKDDSTDESSRPFWVSDAGMIRATKGHIGGFELNDSQIKSTNNNIILNSSGTGSIANFKFDGSRLYSNDENVLISPGYKPEDTNTTFAFWAGETKPYEKKNEDGTVTIINNDNTTRPFWVSDTGTIKATKGHIGGFHIADDHLAGGDASDSDSYKVLMSPGYGGDNNSQFAFWAGNRTGTTDDTRPFWVKNNGQIKATSGDIGIFSVDALNNTITIFNEDNIEMCTFDKQGVKIVDGKLQIDNISFESSGNDEVISRVNTGKYIIKAGSDEDLVASIELNINDKGEEFNQVFWVGLYLKGGKKGAWQPRATMQIRAIDRDSFYGAEEVELLKDFKIKIFYSIAVWNQPYQNILTEELKILAGQSRSDEYPIYTSGDAIFDTYMTAKFDRSEIPNKALDRDFDSICMTGVGQDDSQDYHDVDMLKVTSGDSKKEILFYGNIIPNNEIKADTDSFGLGTKENSWDTAYIKTIYCNSCIQDQDLSDIRYKNSIEALSQKYDTFFDKIKPVRYKYNEGTSKRYHTGFIAQDLVSSLEECELTTHDFAGVLLDKQNTENSRWYLRRDEFVALNTWQIQKLKKRVSELELELKEIKGEKNDSNTSN